MNKFNFCKFVKFLYFLFGFCLITRDIANQKKISLRAERRILNRELARGKRVFYIPTEHFDILSKEFIIAGWEIDVALIPFNSRLRGISVK